MSAYASIRQHTSAYVSRMLELLLRSGRDTWSVTCAMLYLLYLRQQSCELAVRCEPPTSTPAGHQQQAHPQDALVYICTTCSCTGQRAACHSLLLQAHLHTSAYVSIRQHTSAYASMSAYVSIRQHAKAYVSIRKHATHLCCTRACTHVHVQN